MFVQILLIGIPLLYWLLYNNFHILLQVFRKDELQQLLKLIRDSSLANLDHNRGPLGYALE